MNRRRFLKALPSLPVAAMSAVIHRRTEPLPSFKSGDLLTAETVNQIIERINDLGESR
jgi:hypothetical protein